MAARRTSTSAMAKSLVISAQQVPLSIVFSIRPWSSAPGQISSSRARTAWQQRALYAPSGSSTTTCKWSMVARPTMYASLLIHQSSASKVVPYPVASVNGNWFWNTVTYNQYLFELASIQKFYTSQGQDLNSQEGKQKLSQLKNDIIIQLENNLIIEQQARKYGIKVTNKEITDQYNELVKNAGGVEKVKTTLDKLYGWTIDDFKEKIKQSVLQKKLAEKILADESLNAPAKAQAEDLKKQIDGGADFAELAKKFSTDGSASNGGDLGLISKGQTVPEFEAAAFGLQEGQVSGVVKTQYGYHIIKSTKKEGDQVRVSHILIKGADIDSWLKDQRAKAKIVQYFKP